MAQAERRDAAGAPAGLLWAWWRGDALPALPPLPGLAVAPVAAGDAPPLLRRSPEELAGMLAAGQRPYLASLGGRPVAYGIAASGAAAFGTPSTPFRLPPANRYLWEFFTLPAWRGRGIYPRLLQAILAAEAEAERFWIVHRLANAASARGIARAGFGRVGAIHALPGGGFGLVPAGPPARAAAGARVLGLVLLPATGDV